MPAIRPFILVILTASLLAGCGWPRVHKVVVQQGNVISQEMIDKLRPGMTRSQVAFIMGEPVVRNTFNSDRWDYVYTIENPGVFNRNVTMSLFFVSDGLAYFTGDLAPTSALEAEKALLAGDSVEPTEDNAPEVLSADLPGEGLGTTGNPAFGTPTTVTEQLERIEDLQEQAEDIAESENRERLERAEVEDELELDEPG